MPSFVTGLKCVFCGAMYPTRVGLTCPACGITGILDVQYDYRAMSRVLTRRKLASRTDPTHWRYRELLPIGDRAQLPALAVGGTPIVASGKMARHLGVRELLIKDDGRNPTGSLKDRASSVGVVNSSISSGRGQPRSMASRRRCREPTPGLPPQEKISLRAAPMPINWS